MRRNTYAYAGGIAKKIGCEMFEGDMYYGAVRSNVFEKCFLESKSKETN